MIIVLVFISMQFIPPTSLSLDFNVTEGQQKLSIHVPTLELHVTNELYQVIFNFYNTYTTDVRFIKCHSFNVMYYITIIIDCIEPVYTVL